MKASTLIMIVSMLGVAGVAPISAEAASSHHHHLGLFVGLATESKEGREDANGFALGIEWELRFHKHWGVGGAVEALGQDTVRNVLVLLPVSYHPVGDLRLVAGPGVEFTPTKNKFVFRVGLGYSFHLDDHWSLAPEAFLDLVETGERTWAAGLALGYGF